jgi:hypothetical protein
MGSGRNIVRHTVPLRVIVIVHECDLIELELDNGRIPGNPDRDWDHIAISKM